MKVLVVRHGEAEALKTTDADRALTPRGRSDAMALGLQFTSLGYHPSLAITSPYVRARQTLATILESSQCFPPVHVAAGITPDDPVRSAFHVIEPLATVDCLLIVSHLPLVSRLIACLVDGGDAYASRYPMSTASLAELDMDVFAPGSARLVRLISPPYA